MSVDKTVGAWSDALLRGDRIRTGAAVDLRWWRRMRRSSAGWSVSSLPTSPWSATTRGATRAVRTTETPEDGAWTRGGGGAGLARRGRRGRTGVRVREQQRRGRRTRADHPAPGAGPAAGRARAAVCRGPPGRGLRRVRSSTAVAEHLPDRGGPEAADAMFVHGIGMDRGEPPRPEDLPPAFLDMFLRWRRTRRPSTSTSCCRSPGTHRIWTRWRPRRRRSCLRSVPCRRSSCPVARFR